MMVFLFLFSFGICIFEEFSYFYFWGNFFDSKIERHWLRFLAMCLSAGVMFGINLMNISKLNLAFSVVFHILLCEFLYKGNWVKKLYLSFVGVFIMAALEFALMYIIKLKIGGYELRDDIANMILAVIFDKLLTFVILKLICSKDSLRKDVYFASIGKYFYSLPIASMILYIGIDYSDIPLKLNYLPNIILICGCILLFIANIISLVTAEKIMVVFWHNKNKEILDTQNRYEAKKYEQFKKIDHDYRNALHSANDFLITAKILVQKEQWGELRKYIDDCEEKFRPSGKEICNNTVLNAILKGKEWEAENAGVRYEAFVETGFVLPQMNAADITSMLCNLINNAITAAKKCNEGFTTVKLFRNNDGKLAIIKIINNFSEQPVKRKGIFVSQKENPEAHGIGLPYTEALVKDYGGLMKTEIDGQVFTATILFFLN